MSKKNHLLITLALALAWMLAPAAVAAAETAVTIPFSVHAVEPVAGGTVAEPFPALITFSYLDGSTAGWAAFNPAASASVPLFDSDLDPGRFYGLKYPREKYSLFYEHTRVYTLDGVGFLHFYARPDCRTGSLPCLIPGSYRATASHGPEYNTDSFTVRVAWDAGLGRYRAWLSRPSGPAVAALGFRLGHVIDSTGYLGCDFHEHPSDGDTWDPKLRLITDLVMGVEVFGITAHDGYRYYHKLIADFGVQDRILCVPSIETNTIRNHFIVLPQYGYLVDPVRIGPCSPYAEPAVNCKPSTFSSSTYPLDLPGNDTVYSTMKAVALQRLISMRPMYFFVAHPDSGYFIFCLDDQGNLATARNRRSCRLDFDGIERRYRDSRKWVWLYNQGYRFSRLHNTDSHNFVSPPYPGNYIPSPVDSIPPAADRQALVDGLVQRLAAGRSFMTVADGPFLQLLDGATEVSGSTLSGPVHHLRLRITAPATSSPKTGLLQVVNGVITNRTVSYSPVTTPAGPRLEAELPLDLNLDRDSWLMVQSGETSFATNAVWIDQDRDGTITPVIPLPRIELTSLEPAAAAPGDTVTIAFTATPAPVAVQAWVAPNDPMQNSACAADVNCDREAACRPAADGVNISFTCTYVVSGNYPQVERPGKNEVRVVAQGSNGFWGLKTSEITIAYPDTDGDGMDDGWEQINSRPTASPACVLDRAVPDGNLDPDGDGLNNLAELQAGTQPCAADTDGDAVKDGVEVASSCTSPLSADTDLDGYCDGNISVALPSPPVTKCTVGEDMNLNGVRDANETSPCNTDTDGDGLTDTWEKQNYYCLLIASPDGSADPDHDGFSNLQEQAFASNPCVADADADGLNDAQEQAAGTLPNAADTDNDGLKDGAEAAAGADPLDWDVDDDGLADGEELAWGAGMHNPDTDGDGISDGDEVHVYFTSPLAADADGDGLTDGEELVLGTDPLKWDTDDDGLSDPFEVDHLSGHDPGENLDPLLITDGAADFDGDGIENAHEHWNGTDPWAANPAGFIECGYWAESDGDGFITGNDRDMLLSASIGNPTDYSNVFPPTGETQDLDGDGWYTGNDVDLLNSMMVGADTSFVQSRPAALEAIDTCVPTLAVGDTCHVSVSVLNSLDPTPGKQAGIAVVFTVDPSSTGSATIFGGEGAGDLGGRYDLSGTALSSPGGVSRAVVRADAAGTVMITARVPQCGTEVGVGRSSAEIILPIFATVTVP